MHISISYEKAKSGNFLQYVVAKDSDAVSQSYLDYSRSRNEEKGLIRLRIEHFSWMLNNSNISLCYPNSPSNPVNPVNLNIG